MSTGLRTFVLVLLLVAIPVAAWYWMFRPRSKDMQTIRDSVQSMKREIAEVDGTRIQNRPLLDEMRKLKEALTLFKQKLPESKEMEKVILEVCQIAKDNGLTVKSFRTLEVVNRDGYGEQTIRWVMSGTFKPGYLEFLDRLERLPRITRINEMKIEGDEKHPGVVNADFTLTIFFENGGKTVAVAQ